MTEKKPLIFPPDRFDITHRFAGKVITMAPTDLAAGEAGSVVVVERG
jgi:hypothetical protein